MSWLSETWDRTIGNRGLGRSIGRAWDDVWDDIANVWDDTILKVSKDLTKSIGKVVSAPYASAMPKPNAPQTKAPPPSVTESVPATRRFHETATPKKGKKKRRGRAQTILGPGTLPGPSLLNLYNTQSKKSLLGE